MPSILPVLPNLNNPRQPSIYSLWTFSCVRTNWFAKFTEFCFELLDPTRLTKNKTSSRTGWPKLDKDSNMRAKLLETFQIVTFFCKDSARFVRHQWLPQCFGSNDLFHTVACKVGKVGLDYVYWWEEDCNGRTNLLRAQLAVSSPGFMSCQCWQRRHQLNWKQAGSNLPEEAKFPDNRREIQTGARSSLFFCSECLQDRDRVIFGLKQVEAEEQESLWARIDKNHKHALRQKKSKGQCRFFFTHELTRYSGWAEALFLLVW